MGSLWVLHPEVFDQFIIGKINFMKLPSAESAKFVKDTKETGTSYFNLQCMELGSIYHDRKAIRVTVKDGEISGIGKGQLSKIKENLGQEFVDKITSLFEIEQTLEDILYVIKDGEAHIPVTGILRRGRVIDSTYQKWGWGSSTYNEIIVASQLADLDSRVIKAVYDYNTPGGAVDGVDEAGRAIANMKKPTRADVHFWAMSGGYWLASQAKEIRALSPTVQVGSVGVAYEYYDWSKWEDEVGIKLHTITSQNAPDKRPDTKRLDELLQKDADSLEEIFIQRISAGRNVSAEVVKKDFGRGWDLIAAAALKVGMVDKIEGIDNNETLSEGEGEMDPETLKKDHGDVYKKIFGDGHVEGQKNELDRVNAHLSWIGKGKNETIVANIQGEKPCDAACCVVYSDENAAAIVASNRNNDDDGHETTSSEEPGGAGAAAAGLSEDGMVDGDKLEASMKKLGMK